MKKSEALQWEVSWNVSRMSPEKAEDILQMEGMKIVQHGVAPFALLRQRGKYIIVEATREQIKSLFTKYPHWMLIENRIYVIS